MPTDVAMKFTRTGKIVQIGEVVFTVDDPSDEEEVKKKLEDNDFKVFKITGQEIIKPTWKFE